MLTIRNGQLRVFSGNEVQTFEDRMLKHLRKIFPEQSEILGEKEARRVIQHGIERARIYGIVAQRDVCKYIDLVMIFGRNLDLDPKLKWASDTLKAEFLNGRPSEKIKRLCDLAFENSQAGNPKTGALGHD